MLKAITDSGANLIKSAKSGSVFQVTKSSTKLLVKTLESFGAKTISIAKKAGAAVTVVAFGVDVIIDIASGENLAESIIKNGIMFGIGAVVAYGCVWYGAPAILTLVAVGAATSFGEFVYNNLGIGRYIIDVIFGEGKEEHVQVGDIKPIPSRPVN